MIRRLDAITGLAIVGMSVVLPNGDGIDEFGRRVYRGLQMSDPSDNDVNLEDSVIQSVREIHSQGRLAGRQLPVISLSPSLDGILQKGGISSRFQEVQEIPSALETAADWLEVGGDGLVLLLEAYENPQVVCAILVAEHKSALDNARPVYAVVTGGADAKAPLNSLTISAVLQEARRAAGIQPDEIGLIETASMTGAGIKAEEADGLLAAFSQGQPLTCALCSSMAGLLGILKIVWCLSRRVIPGVSDRTGPAPTNIQQETPFYVPAESRTWFVPSKQGRRHAGLNFLATDGSFSHILFSEAPSTAPKSIEALKQETLRLFPLSSRSIGHLLEKITNLQTKLASGANLASVAQDAYRQYLLEKPTADYTACLLGQTPEELLREIGFALKGIHAAFEKKSDWQTPLGSFFTPQPLGKDGKVSFVYPGAFNSYPGVGRDLFYLFPDLYGHISGITGDIGNLLNDTMLYPRSMAALTADDLNTIETRLTADPITMLISGSCLAYLYTHVLRNIFGIHPASAFGYSLGEVSMLFASGVWTEADATSKALRESPLFHTRLTGPQNAVREFWNLPIRSKNDTHESLWVNYLLMTGPEKVREVLAAEPHVYLTHINTPRQVVIGGDPAGCRRVIDRLRSKSIQAPFNYAIHCEAIQSEYDLLVELHSVPVMCQPGMTLYSAATFQPMPIDQKKIAEQVAFELCHCLDFPRLIRQAHDDGGRIFIELGAGSNCARWVNDTLESSPHAAYSINRKGVDDFTSLLRLMARVVSQQIPVNLSALYQD